MINLTKLFLFTFIVFLKSFCEEEELRFVVDIAHRSDNFHHHAQKCHFIRFRHFDNQWCKSFSAYFLLEGFYTLIEDPEHFCTRL
jgi:hypothetical protein